MLRLIDANLNRTLEGLRLLEDVARFLLNNAELSEQLKALRHQLGEQSSLKGRLLLARDSAADVGAFAEVPGEMERKDLPSLVIANAKRVEESLRVLEEFAKLPQGPLEAAVFKKARFALYEIEQELVGRLLRRQKRERIAGLYVIIDAEALGGREEIELARQAIEGGAKAIQLRDKHRDKGTILATATKLRELCSRLEALFIVNDYLDIALASDADGLHLGQRDLPISAARPLLPLDKILGCSTSSVEKAVEAQADGADYIAVGAIYPTPSKADSRVVGLNALRQIREAISIPIVAIGGIDEENAPDVIAAGADSIAVIGAVLGAEDVKKAASKLAARFEVN